MPARKAAPRPRTRARTRTRARGENLEARLDFVEELVTRACGYREVRALCAEKWGIGPRQADEYVSKVYERWRTERHADRGSARERQRRRLLRYLRRADEQRNLRAAKGFEELLMRLEGTDYVPSDDLAAGGVDVVEVVDPPDDEADT